MDHIKEELLKSFEDPIIFEIPIFGGIPVPETVVITWLIMAGLTIFFMFATRDLKISPKPNSLQIYLEMLVGFFDDSLADNLGHEGKRYTQFLTTIAIFLLAANSIGLFGIFPPTKNINVTAGLALVSIILIEYAGLRAKGLGGFLKSFTEPAAFMLPLKVLEVFIRPLSLCLRLFGNILGGFIIIEMVKAFVPLVLPLPFNLFFDVFDAGLQAYIFVFLTSLYIGEVTE